MHLAIIVAAFATLPPALSYLTFPYGFEVSWVIVFVFCRLFPVLMQEHRPKVIGGLLIGAALIASISMNLFSVERREAIEAVSSWSFLARTTSMQRLLTERAGNDSVYTNTIACFVAVMVLPLFFWDYSRSDNRETYPVKMVGNKSLYWIGFGTLGLYAAMLKYNHMVYPFYRQTTPEQAQAIQHKYVPILNVSFDSWVVVGLVVGATLSSILLTGWVQLIESFLRRTPR